MQPQMNADRGPISCCSRRGRSCGLQQERLTARVHMRISISFGRETLERAPKGRQRVAPGVSPGLGHRAVPSPKGATQETVGIVFGVAPSGLLHTQLPNPGLTPGAIFCRPSGPPIRVSRQSSMRRGRTQAHESCARRTQSGVAEAYFRDRN